MVYNIAMDILLLKQIPLFSSLSNEELTQLGGLLNTRVIPDNQVIFWIGENGDQMFLIKSGEVKLSCPNEQGKDIPIATVGQGAFFGDLSLLDEGPRTATAIAKGEVTLWVLDRESFFMFLEKHPKAARVMVTTLSRRMRENMDKLKSVKNINEEADQRLTPLQMIVDKLAGLFSTGGFLLFNILFFLCWVAIQTYTVYHDHWEKITFMDDPPTFYWLCFMMGTESLFLTVFILNSQKRSAERDRLRADFEYQVNVKAQTEIMQLHQKMDKLLDKLNTK
jgi:uncharacterized membrane protein